jgi:uncharacterized protein with von Willebrand factor type A (vWA) domain
VTGPDTALRSLVGFAWLLRGTGIAAGPERVQAMVRAVSELAPPGPADVYWAGRLCLCSGPADLPVYDRAFAHWFGREQLPAQHVVDIAETADVTGPGEAAQARRAHVDRSSPASASEREMLRDKDIALMSDGERAQLRGMLAMLALPPPQRSRRRRRPAARGRVDSRRTVRAMLRRGGELGRVYYHDAGTRPRRVVLLLDVSGSMSAYSDLMLRYAYACVRRRSRTEGFTLGTRLTRITRQLTAPGPDAAMAAVASAIADWNGGTRLGASIKDFLDHYGQGGLARGAIVVVASDGWESGDAGLLGNQMLRLRRLACRVVWVHPHRARPGFQPLTGGIAAALPSVDDFVAGHSLAALAALSELLSAGDRRHPAAVQGMNAAESEIRASNLR